MTGFWESTPRPIVWMVGRSDIDRKRVLGNCNAFVGVPGATQAILVADMRDIRHETT
jgi:hypothetical protein